MATQRGGGNVARELNPNRGRKRYVGFPFRRCAEHHLGRGSGERSYCWSFLGGRRFVRRLRKLKPVSRDLEPLQPASLLDDAADLEPAAGVNASIERQIEAFALRAGTAHPDRGIGRANHEIPPASSWCIGKVSPEVSTGELADHGDSLIQVARWIEHDGAD